MGWKTESGHLSIDGRNWTVEEMLEQALADIRSGEKPATHAVLLLREAEVRQYKMWRRTAGASPDEVVMMLWEQLFDFMKKRFG